MRWQNPYRFPDIRKTIDKYGLYDRTLMMLRTKMAGAGSPCTYWRNMGITFYGTLPTDLTKCYCWQKNSSDPTGNQSQPKRDHFLCMGTGYLKGYQKYGYDEIVISTPNDQELTFSSDSLNIGKDVSGEPDRFILSGTSLSEYIETFNIELTNFLSVDRFLAKEGIDKDENRIKYFYSTNDGSDWGDFTELTMTDYTENALGNKQATNLNLSSETTQIKFRIRFDKRRVTSPSPILNSIRFRYRNHINLIEMDQRFNITIPGFLACREAPTEKIVQSEYGWKTTKPMMWWVLPEANIKRNDIIMFLQGEFENQKYEIQNLTKHTYGPDLKVLHRSFESVYLRDSRDIIRIVDLLN